MSDAAAKKDEGTQEVLFVFDNHEVEKQFLKLTGAGALEVDDTIEHGDEVILEIRGIAQDSSFKTRNRGKKDSTAKVTTVTRGLKVVSATVKRTVPQQPRLVK